MRRPLFDVPPKCPALADKISGLFGWRHTYRVQHKQKGIPHATAYLQKRYSLQLPGRDTVNPKNGSPERRDRVRAGTNSR